VLLSITAYLMPPAMFGLLYVTATGVGTAVSTLLVKCVPGGGDSIGGCPRGAFIFSMIFQAFVFPSLVVCSYASFDASASTDRIGSFGSGTMLFSWLASASPGIEDIHDLLFEDVFLLCLGSCMMKDFLVGGIGDDVAILAHHVAAIIAVVVAHSPTLMPHGKALFCAGSATLELGSLVFNLVNLYPDSQRLQYAHVFAQILSNGLALLLILFFALHPSFSTVPASVRAVFLLFVVILTVIRHNTMRSTYKEWKARQDTAEAAAAAAEAGSYTKLPS